MARSYDDIVQELGQRYGRMDSSDPTEIENLQRTKDIFDAAIAQGFSLPSSGRERRRTTDDMASEFLKQKGTFDQVLSSAGVLNKAKKRGYTGADVYGAIQFNDSFNAAYKVAQQAGLNPREGMTFADLEALSGQNQEKFNKTATEGNISQNMTPLEAQSQNDEIEDAELVSNKTQDKSKNKQNKVNLPTGLIQFQTPKGVVYGFYDGKKIRAATGQETTDAALGKAKYQTVKSKTDKPFEEFVPGGVMVTNPPVSGGDNGAPKFGTSNYTGPSIVDFLKSVGQPSDFASRQKLAQSMGIQNYSGTAEQNTSLLNMLRKGNEQGSTTTQTQPQDRPDFGGEDENDTSVVDEILKGYGVSGKSADDFAKNPVKSFQEMYEEIYDNMGISTVKNQIEKYSKEIQKFDDAQADAIQEINDNPWLTEGIRQARIRSLEEKNETKRTNLLAQLEIAQGLYNDSREEARFVAQNAASQYNKAIDFQQDLYMHALDRAEQLEDAKAKLIEDDPQNYRSVQGGLYNLKTKEWVIPPKPGKASEIDEPSAGYEDEDVEASVREDAVELLDQVDAGELTLSQAYNKLRRLYSSKEVSDQALREILGVLTPGQASTKTSPSLSVGGSDLYSYLFSGK